MRRERSVAQRATLPGVRLNGQRDEYVPCDFTRGKSRLPDLQQFGMEEAARRAVERVVQNDVSVIEIN
jgi:hypothetical protein